MTAVAGKLAERTLVRIGDQLADLPVQFGEAEEAMITQPGENPSRGSTRRLRPLPYRKSATACRDDGCATVTVEITHPFHPLRGTRIQLATRRQNWGEDRVMFYDEHGLLVSILASWTDVESF